MVVARFICQGLRGVELTVYGDGEQSRSFTSVYDVVKALHLLMTTPSAEGEVFNVAGHSEINIRDLAQLVIERTGSSSRIVFVPFAEVYGEGFEQVSPRPPTPSNLEPALTS